MGEVTSSSRGPIKVPLARPSAGIPRAPGAGSAVAVSGRFPITRLLQLPVFFDSKPQLSAAHEVEH